MVRTARQINRRARRNLDDSRLIARHKFAQFFSRGRRDHSPVTAARSFGKSMCGDGREPIRFFRFLCTSALRENERGKHKSG